MKQKDFCKELPPKTENWWTLYQRVKKEVKLPDFGRVILQYPVDGEVKTFEYSVPYIRQKALEELEEVLPSDGSMVRAYHLGVGVQIEFINLLTVKNFYDGKS